MNKLHAIYLLCTALALPTLTHAQAPSVGMTVNGTGLSATVVATATPTTIYRISKIEFYLDAATTPTFTKLITTLTTPGAPVTASYKFNCLTEGAHKFTVKAYDNAPTPRVGSVTTTNAMNFVDAAPVINDVVLTPSTYTNGNDFYYASPTNVSATANVTDDCKVSKVEFYLNGILVSTQTNAPYQYNFLLTQYTQLQVVAYDDKIRQFPTTTARNLYMTINYPPFGGIVSATIGTPPVAYTTFFDPGAITIKASAYDYTGAVTKMELYNGATLLGTSIPVKDLTVPAGNAPKYDATFTLPAGLAAGVYDLTVKAYDSYGASALFNAYRITVNRCADVNEPADNAAPTATVLAPTGIVFSKIGSATDVDYYKITPASNTIVVLSGVNATGGATTLPLDYDMVVFAGSGKSTMPIAVSDQDGTAIEGFYFGNLGADGVKSFIIKVYGYNGANSPSCYRLEAFANNGAAKNIVARPSQKGVIVEGMQSSLTLVPNPASNEVALVTSIEQAGEYQLAITDLVGRTLRTETVALNAGDNVTPINISEMNKGMYIVRLWNQNQQLTQKLSVEK